MNPLIDKLPETIEVSGSFFAIETDFRASIRFELMMHDPEIPENEQALEALKIYLPYLDWDSSDPDDRTLFIAEHAKEAIQKICDFYIGAEKASRHRGRSSGGSAKQIYDYEFDAAEIYASFRTAYNIDLSKSQLHWWQFHDLLLSLPDDTPIKKIMRIRATKPDPKASAAERSRIAKLKDLYALPTRISRKDQEHQNQIEAILMGDGDLSKLEEVDDH